MLDQNNLKNNDERLWRLIEERSDPNADAVEIDRRIWELFGEEWTIVVTDLAGFSRKTASFGITHFLQVIFTQRSVLFPVIDEFGGFLVKAEADSLILLFRNPAAALDAVIEMHKACEIVNRRLVPEEHLLLCVGMGYGKILRVGESELWGREVNAASKLGEDTANQGEILVSQDMQVAVAESHKQLQFTKLHGLQIPGTEQAFRVEGW